MPTAQTASEKGASSPSILGYIENLSSTQRPDSFQSAEDIESMGFSSKQNTEIDTLNNDQKSSNASILQDLEILEDLFETNPISNQYVKSMTCSSKQNTKIGTLKYDNVGLYMKRRTSPIEEFTRVETNKRKKPSYRLSMNAKFYTLFLVFPTIALLYFASTFLFSPKARQRFPFLVWTDSALKMNDVGNFTVCPRESICSEGKAQIIFLCISRATAFASYATLGITFLSKMNCVINWLSFTYASTIIPFGNLHKIHKKTGTIYFTLIILHTVGHLIRWFIRGEVMKRINTLVGISGLISISMMICVVLSMSSMAKAMMTFETRLNVHYLSLVLAGALCFHTGRCRYMTLTFV